MSIILYIQPFKEVLSIDSHIKHCKQMPIRFPFFLMMFISILVQFFSISDSIRHYMICHSVRKLVSQTLRGGGGWCVSVCVCVVSDLRSVPVLSAAAPPSQRKWGPEFIFYRHVCLCLARTKYVQNYRKQTNTKL